MLKLLGITLLAFTTGREPISLDVYPRVSSAPATVEIRVVIPPNPSNRSFVVAIDGDDFYTSTSRQLEGESATKRWTFRYRDLPVGEYEVDAALFDVEGKEHRATSQTLLVR